MPGFRKQHRLFLLAEPRSGSSWLMETLNSHPGIDLQGEILNPALNGDIAKFVRGGSGEHRDCLEYLEEKLAIPGKETARFSGCKVLLNQMIHIGRGFPELFLDFNRKAFFVFLYRANLVSGEISLQLAHKFDVWHVKQEEQVTLKRIHLPPRALVRNLERSLRSRNKMRRFLEAVKRRCFSLSYEELFSQRESTLARIISFLGLDPAPLVVSSELKGNPFRPEEVVENYAKVRAALEPYPHFLEMLLAESPNRGAVQNRGAGSPRP